MAEEKTVALDCDQFENFKEEFIKAFKSEVSKAQSGNLTALMQKIEDIARTTELTAEQVTNFINRIGQAPQQPVIEVQQPDMTGVNKAFGRINVNTAILAEAMKRINAEVKTALSDEKIKAAVQQFVSREIEKYIEALDANWKRVDHVLERLLERIPYKYDINKRLVKTCI